MTIDRMKMIADYFVACFVVAVAVDSSVLGARFSITHTHTHITDHTLAGIRQKNKLWRVDEKEKWRSEEEKE